MTQQSQALDDGSSDEAINENAEENREKGFRLSPAVLVYLLFVVMITPPLLGVRVIGFLEKETARKVPGFREAVRNRTAHYRPEGEGLDLP